MAMSTAIIRACLLYEFKLGSKAAEACRKICTAFGEDAVAERTCQKWFKKFASGDECLEDKPRSGRPSTINDDDIKLAIEQDSSQTCQALALRFNVSDETVRMHLHHLGKRWKLSKWVPYELNEANKLQRLTICTSLLSRHNLAPFFDRMLTCDEKWIMYSNKKRAHHWLSSNDPLPLTAKPSIHQEKMLLCVWWTTAGIVHFELLPSGQTITAEIYSAQLNRVSVALSQKQPALANRKGVVFHQDNARPHTARITQETLARLQWELLPHPPYSPDLAPSDYHLFLALDNHMRNRVFQNRRALEDEVTQFFNSKKQDFYKKGIYDLVSKWEKVILAEGDYFSE